jgi:hypothetical protein
MVENHEPVAQNPSDKARFDEKMERQRSPENDIHITTAESAVETQDQITQTSAQVPVHDSTGPATLRKSDEAQATDQIGSSSSANPFTSMSDEEFRKAKDEQKLKDEQHYQELKGHLQKIQNGESQSRASDPGTDQDEEYYRCLGQ